MDKKDTLYDKVIKLFNNHPGFVAIVLIFILIVSLEKVFKAGEYLVGLVTDSTQDTSKQESIKDTVIKPGNGSGGSDVNRLLRYSGSTLATPSDVHHTANDRNSTVYLGEPPYSETVIYEVCQTGESSITVLWSEVTRDPIDETENGQRGGNYRKRVDLDSEDDCIQFSAIKAEIMANHSDKNTAWTYGIVQ